MASAFGHAALALGIATASSKSVHNPLVICLGVFSSVMPDFDVIAFNFGIPYHHMWGHRGMTHSIFFAFLWSLIVTLLYKKWKNPLTSIAALRIFLFILYCTITHGILDAMTTGGMGIAFFAPFSDQRYFLPWRVIRVSPLSIDAFFSHRAFRILKSEALWIGIPSIILALIGIIRIRNQART